MKLIISEAGIKGIKGTIKLKPVYSEEYNKEMDAADKRIKEYHKYLIRAAVKSKNYIDIRR